MGYDDNAVRQRRRDRMAQQNERTRLQQGAQWAERQGVGDQWQMRNAKAVGAAGGYLNPADGGATPAAGAPAAPQRGRWIGAGSGMMSGQSVNWGLVNAYQNNPQIRALMDQQGAAPTFNGVNISGNATQGTYGRTAGGRTMGGGGLSNPYQMQYQPTGGAQPGAMPMQAPQGYPGMGGGGGAAGLASGGLPTGQASGLASRMAGQYQQLMAKPPGLPTGAMYSQVADARGAAGQREQEALRADFARRGQSGTAAEAAALRDLESRTSGARTNDYRDIMLQNALAQIANRYKTLGLSNQFLLGQQQGDRAQLGLMLGMA